VLRGAVGFAYYPYNQPGLREQIPDGKTASRLAHNSIKGPNVLVGDLSTPEDDEHEHYPLLKVYVNKNIRALLCLD
jgi:hypothetical protein